jgi:hypothetical protein
MKQTIQFYRDSLEFKMRMAFLDADNPECADLSKDGMLSCLYQSAMLVWVLKKDWASA